MRKSMMALVLISIPGRVLRKNRTLLCCFFVCNDKKNSTHTYSFPGSFTGRSGCGKGKSTALQLLLRFYRVDSGSVEVDSENVTDMNIGWLRENIGYVGQMPVLFAGSIRDNIKVSHIIKGEVFAIWI